MTHPDLPEAALATRAIDADVTAQSPTRESVRQALGQIFLGNFRAAAAAVVADGSIPEDVRARVDEKLPAQTDRSTCARILGDELRATGVVLNPDVIECYRASFYLGRDWLEYVANPLFARFSANKAAQAFDKWIHYFDIYLRTLQPYIGRPVRVLEIGVYHGGGLDQLEYLLGEQATLVGADINEEARAVCAGRFEVEVGDQTDPAFLSDLIDKRGPFDIIIDDGGHTMNQQITAAERLFPTLNDGGVYIVEDTHTSYWQPFIDGPTTFMDWTKQRLDDINGYHHQTDPQLPVWTTALTALHIYDSVVVMEKGRHLPPFCEVAGTGSFLSNTRDAEQLLLRYRAASATAEVQLAAAHHQAAEAHERLTQVMNSRTWRLAARLQRLSPRRRRK